MIGAASLPSTATAAVPPEGDALAPPPGSLRAPLVLGLSTLALGLGGFVLWAANAPIAAATIAPGRVIVEGRTKTVSHLEGGTIAEILVEEGDRVARGDVLVRLDATRSAARLAELDDQAFALTVKRARLEQEQAGRAAFEAPAALAALAAGRADRLEVLAAERVILAARRQQLADERRVTDSVVAQLAERRAAVAARLAARRSAAAELAVQLTGLERLFAKKLTVVTRVTEARIALADARSEAEALGAELSEVDRRVDEAERASAARVADHAREVAESLQEVQLALAAAEQQRRAAADVVDKGEVRAPEAGVVLNLRTNTRGSAVAAGQPLMDLVPDGLPLVVEGYVRPQDIDTVHPGLPAEIHFSAFFAPVNEPVRGTVTYVAADARADERTGETFYPVRATLDPDSLAAARIRTLTPGMSAELYVIGETRSALDYLLRPVRESFRRAWREE